MPSVGRVVHYIAYGSSDGEGFPSGVRRAAIITETDWPGNPESPIGLAIFNPTGLLFQQHVPFAEWQKSQTGSEAGGWEWPPHVPPVVWPPES